MLLPEGKMERAVEKTQEKKKRSRTNKIQTDAKTDKRKNKIYTFVRWTKMIKGYTKSN